MFDVSIPRRAFYSNTCMPCLKLKYCMTCILASSIQLHTRLILLPTLDLYSLNYIYVTDGCLLQVVYTMSCIVAFSRCVHHVMDGCLIQGVSWMVAFSKVCHGWLPSSRCVMDGCLLQGVSWMVAFSKVCHGWLPSPRGVMDGCLLQSVSWMVAFTKMCTPWGVREYCHCHCHCHYAK